MSGNAAQSRRLNTETALRLVRDRSYMVRYELLWARPEQADIAEMLRKDKEPMLADLALYCLHPASLDAGEEENLRWGAPDGCLVLGMTARRFTHPFTGAGEGGKSLQPSRCQLEKSGYLGISAEIHGSTPIKPRIWCGVGQNQMLIDPVGVHDVNVSGWSKERNLVSLG
jgi:hypothetical protein